MNQLHRIAIVVLVPMYLACAASVVYARRGEAAVPPPAPSTVPANLDAAWSALPSYKYGQDQKALDMISQAVMQSQQDLRQRTAMAGRLAAFLAQADATPDAKDFCCRQLYLIATAAEIPAVARLLPDERLSHMSRYVLEAMGDPAADAAMRSALASLKGSLLIGVINSLGNRRDAQCVESFTKYLAGADAGIACAAAIALGKIGTADAAQALSAAKPAAPEVQSAVADGLLIAADHLFRAGKKDEALAIYGAFRGPDRPARLQLVALRGMIMSQPEKAADLLAAMLKSDDAVQQTMACSFAAELPGEGVARAFASLLPSLKPPTQVAVINALAVRGDTAARQAIATAVASEQAEVRLAAIKALGTLGDGADLPVLLKCLAAAGPESEAAKGSLVRLKGEKVDSDLVAALGSVSAQVKPQLIAILTSRKATSATPALLAIAQGDADASVRTAALSAIGTLGDEKAGGPLVDRIVAALGDEREAARRAYLAIAARIPKRDAYAAPLLAALAKADAPARAAMISSMPGLGTAEALTMAKKAMADADAAIQDAGIRALADWPDATAVPDLLGVLKSQNQTHRVLALRALSRLLALPSQRTAAQTAALYEQMLSAATRPDDKKLVLAGLGELKEPFALDMALPLLLSDVRNEAATAIIKITRNLPAAHKDKAREALKQVIDTKDVDANVRRQAQDAMGRIR